MTDELIEAVAFTLWKAEAERAAPNVAKNRTPEQFRDDTREDERSRWIGLARAAIRVIAPAVLEQAANVAPAKIRAETCETVGQWERRALREAIRALKEGYSHDQ